MKRCLTPHLLLRWTLERKFICGLLRIRFTLSCNKLWDSLLCSVRLLCFVFLLHVVAESASLSHVFASQCVFHSFYNMPHALLNPSARESCCNVLWDSTQTVIFKYSVRPFCSIYSKEGSRRVVFGAIVENRVLLVSSQQGCRLLLLRESIAILIPHIFCGSLCRKGNGGCVSRPRRLYFFQLVPANLLETVIEKQKKNSYTATTKDRTINTKLQ